MSTGNADPNNQPHLHDEFLSELSSKATAAPLDKIFGIRYDIIDGTSTIDIGQIDTNYALTAEEQIQVKGGGYYWNAELLGVAFGDSSADRWALNAYDAAIHSAEPYIWIPDEYWDFIMTNVLKNVNGYYWDDIELSYVTECWSKTYLPNLWLYLGNTWY